MSDTLFPVLYSYIPPLLPEGTIEPPDPDYDGRQARLLAAVKERPDVLRRWIANLVAYQMLAHFDYEWIERILGSPEPELRDLLGPALGALPQDDQALFREYDEAGYLYEAIDMFRDSFTVTESPVRVEMIG